MKISINGFVDKCIWVLTTYLLVSFLAFNNYPWGKYTFVVASVLIALLAAVGNNGRIRIKLQAYHLFFVLFIFYVLLSSLWAWSFSDSVSKAMTLIQILLCSAMAYLYYERKDSIQALLQAVMWAGYILAIYAMAYYGAERLATASSNRLDSEFVSVNSIGMVTALACVLQINELLCGRNKWTAVMMVPAIMMVAFTQSKKAIIFLVAGVLGLLALRTIQQKASAKGLLKMLVVSAVLITGLVFVLRMPIFEGLIQRLEYMIATSDYSTRERQAMVKLGMEYFYQYPIGGIGIGCSHILSSRYLQNDTYLHNNFVELLSGGGIFGFAAYYVIYVYLFVNLFKYRRADKEMFTIGVVWLVLMLVMNYGMVTYYTKWEWYYLMIHFINVNCLKKKHKEMLRCAKKVDSISN